MKLTKKVIDQTKHPSEGQTFLRDDTLRGFAVRITPGSKAFILEKAINGRVRRLTLGTYGELTIDQARDIAHEKIVEIARGRDPAAEKKARRQAARWHDLEQLYLARHAVHKKSKGNDIGMLERHLSVWRPRRLSSITRGDVSGLHADIGGAGHQVTANAVVRLVRTMFNLAHDWGLHDGPNPASKWKMFKEVSRDRFVRPDELPRLWKALEREPNPYVRAAFVVGLLTGARRSEVLRMKWSDLDVGQCVWRIGETKAGCPHYVPLPKPVLDELRQLPHLNGNEYVFVGRWGKKNLTNISKPWRRIRKEAGLDDVRIHDLRRTLGSWLVAAGASLPLIGKALNHSQAATTAIYARLELDPVRQALEANAERMLAVVKKDGGTT